MNNGIINQYMMFLRFTMKHKWYVFVECCKLGIPWRGIKHDMGKLRPKAFHAYSRRWAAGNSYKAIDDITYLKVFANHLRRSEHHWQYWSYVRNSGEVRYLPMPDGARKEFLADLRGSSKYYGTDIIAWYDDNRHFIHLHADTRNWLESMLGVTYPQEHPCQYCGGDGIDTPRRFLLVIPAKCAGKPPRAILCPECDGSGEHV